MRYELHPEAEQELYEAASRYEAEVRELGLRFADEVESVIQLLLEHPELGSRLDDNLRHFVLRRFPFSICMRQPKTSCTSWPLRTEAESPATGGCVCKTANKLFEPTCETHAAQQ
jgi:hypothetical protein